MVTPIGVYRITDTTSKQWYAVVYEGGGIKSTRETGKLQPDHLFEWQDLIMPEQRFIEWDVKEIDLR